MFGGNKREGGASETPVGMDAELARRYLQIARADIAYLRFTLEAYDGLAFIRTVEKEAAVVEFCYPPSQQQLAEGFLQSILSECPWREVQAPPGLLSL